MFCFINLKFTTTLNATKTHLRGLIHYSNDPHADRRKGLINYVHQEKKTANANGSFCHIKNWFNYKRYGLYHKKEP